MQIVGERIKKVRLSQKLSQEAFGKMLGLSHSQISKIENGRDAPSDMLLRLIMHEFKLSYEWLHSGKGAMYFKPDAEMDACSYEANKDHQKRIAVLTQKFSETFVDSESLLFEAHHVQVFLSDALKMFTHHSDSETVGVIVAYQIMSIMENLTALVCSSAPQTDADMARFCQNYIEISDTISLRLKETYDLIRR